MAPARRPRRRNICARAAEMETRLPAQSPSCRGDLYVSRSQRRDAAGRQYSFWGLYCHAALARGDFIGMYAGAWAHDTAAFEWGNRYTVQAASMLVSPPGQRPDPQRYPIAMANEPSAGEDANAALHAWVFERDEVDAPDAVRDDEFHGVGLVACVDIPAHAEILWFYGRSYDALRDYAPGRACDAPPGARPPAALGRKLPYDRGAWRAHAMAALLHPARKS